MVVVGDEEFQQLLMQRDDSTSSSSETTCSTPELDVVGSDEIPSLTQQSPPPTSGPSGPNEKRYLCQRCLNHGGEFPRKGHKPYCQYARCECNDCIMVEKRRQLNNQLSQRRLDPNAARPPPGKKIRDPKCALCSAHGVKEPLKGHKKSTCPYNACGCNTCHLVANRRCLMARQIKLRRVQQKAKRQQELNGGDAEQQTTPKPLVIRAKSASPTEVGISLQAESPQQPTTPPAEELPTPVPIRPTAFNPATLQPLLAAALAHQNQLNPFFFPAAAHLNPIAAAMSMPLQPQAEMPPLMPNFGMPVPQISPFLASLMSTYCRPA